MERIIIKEMSLDAAKKLGIEEWARWECEPSTFDWQYSQQETAYVFEGDVLITAGDEQVHIKPNMLVSFPAGMKCVWNVRKTIRKAYIFNFPLD